MEEEELEEEEEEEKKERDDDLEGKGRRRSFMPRRRCFMPRSVHSFLTRRAHSCLGGRRPFMPTWAPGIWNAIIHVRLKRNSIMPRRRLFSHLEQG